MKEKYNIGWLKSCVENGENPKYLFFWGHTKKANQAITNTCFSQWYASPFKVNGITYQTTEHWMMAQKALLFDNDDIQQQIIESSHPAEAKKLGRKVTGFDESIWKQHRTNIVRIGNIHKFNQNRALGGYLLNTKKRVLVEASPYDRIWGIGLTKDSEAAQNVYAWRGLNLLGFALMEVRDFLSSHGFFDYDFNFNPPWIEAPQTDAQDTFWKSGKGKKIQDDFIRNWNALSDKEKEIFKVSFPEPKSWMGFYEI